MSNLRFAQRVAIVLFPPIILLLVGEVGARIWYFYQNGRDLNYLLAPFRGDIRPRAVYPYDPRKTFTLTDPCSGREITFTLNKQGVRGPDWTFPKPHDVCRIVAVGGSSTFGANNTDQATWPAFLEQALRGRIRNKKIEVLNAGQSGCGLATFIESFSSRWADYQPDMVIYYEAWNDAELSVAPAVHQRISAFRQNRRVWRLSDWLYNRSLLYAYLVEKIQFSLATRNREGIVPDFGRFQAQLDDFIRLLWAHKVTPVLVLQVFDTPTGPSMQDLPWDDPEQIRALILKVVRANASTTNHMLTKILLAKAQVLVETVRRTGQNLGVQVIDPRPAFAHYRGEDPLFCDVVHLTDRGNQLLAQTIAKQIHLPVGSGVRVASQETVLSSLEVLETAR